MTTVWNAVLIRYGGPTGGHTYVDRSDGAGRRELYLEMGGVTDETLARSYGAQFLALSRDEITTLAQQGQVRSISEQPGIGLSIGDHTPDGDMIQSIAAQLTGDGDAQLTVEVGDARRSRLDALNRQLQRAGSGARSEYSAPKLDAQVQGTGNDSPPPTWSLSGELTGSEVSTSWVAPRIFHWSWMELILGTPGSTFSRVELRRRVTGSRALETVGSARIEAGDERSVTIWNTPVRTGTEVLLVVTHAGTGAKDLSAIPRGAMI